MRTCTCAYYIPDRNVRLGRCRVRFHFDKYIYAGFLRHGTDISSVDQPVEHNHHNNTSYLTLYVWTKVIICYLVEKSNELAMNKQGNILCT